MLVKNLRGGEKVKAQINVLHDAPDRVELTKGQRGGYGWKISVNSNDVGFVLDKLKQWDEELRRRFPRELQEIGQE